MNAGRALYLGTYSIIDSIDHPIKNCRLKYRIWKYWHSPMLHAMELAIVITYYMYLELLKGKLASEWKPFLVIFGLSMIKCPNRCYNTTH